MKAARDYLERKRLQTMRQATKKSVSGKRDATPAPTRPSSAGKAPGICYDFQAGKCTRGKDCRYKHEKSDKGKGGGKKGKSRPSQEALVGLCLQDLGTKCVSLGRQGSVNVEMTVLSNTRRSLQLHLPKMTSVERAKTRRRRTRRRATAPARQVEVPTPRRALRVSKIKGENRLPLAQLQFA